MAFKRVLEKWEKGERGREMGGCVIRRDTRRSGEIRDASREGDIAK